MPPQSTPKGLSRLRAFTKPSKPTGKPTGKSTAAALHNLPAELLCQIAMGLNAKDIDRLSLTCRRVNHQITHNEQYMVEHIVRRRFPLANKTVKGPLVAVAQLEASRLQAWLEYPPPDTINNSIFRPPPPLTPILNILDRIVYVAERLDPHQKHRLFIPHFPPAQRAAHRARYADYFTTRPLLYLYFLELLVLVMLLEAEACAATMHVLAPVPGPHCANCRCLRPGFWDRVLFHEDVLDDEALGAGHGIFGGRAAMIRAVAANMRSAAVWGCVGVSGIMEARTRTMRSGESVRGVELWLEQACLRGMRAPRWRDRAKGAVRRVGRVLGQPFVALALLDLLAM